MEFLVQCLDPGLRHLFALFHPLEAAGHLLPLGRITGAREVEEMQLPRMLDP